MTNITKPTIYFSERGCLSGHSGKMRINYLARKIAKVLSNFLQHFAILFYLKVEKILKGSLDSISSPSPSVKIKIMGSKVCLRCRGKSLLTTPSNALPYHLK
jgi:hypothetical protein